MSEIVSFQFELTQEGHANIGQLELAMLVKLPANRMTINILSNQVNMLQEDREAILDLAVSHYRTIVQDPSLDADRPYILLDEFMQVLRQDLTHYLTSHGMQLDALTVQSYVDYSYETCPLDEREV